ncbi:TPA: protein ren [Citrobacter werkmanii]|nr:protein ren [Citrobacter werkmanii]
MTGKDAIRHYLALHKYFTITDLMSQFSCSKSMLCGAASSMVRRGELSRVRREDGAVVYYPVFGRNGSRESGDIFELCRNSPAMKRILVVWGVLAPEVLERQGDDMMV